MADKSLYERLGGVFAIAAVVDHFSGAISPEEFDEVAVTEGSKVPAGR